MNVPPRLVWLCFLLCFPAAAIPADRIVVYASAAGESEGLAETLGAKDGGAIQVVRSTAEALRANADVVVLFRARSDEPPLKAEELELLKTKKVIGIGWGAAQLFDSARLQVNTDCVHGTVSQSPRMAVPKSSLLPDSAGNDVPAFVPSVDASKLQAISEKPFGLYLPLFDEKTQEVEAIARWKDDRAYAVAARQGNHVLVGINTPVETWSPELKTLLRDTARSLAKAPNVPFALPRRPLTQPGSYAFELHPNRNYTEPNTKNFFFRFPKPGRFTAVLEHQGSEAIMLLFADSKGVKWSRQDASKDKGTTGDTLRIELDITQKELDRIGDDYCKLRVVNFDRTKDSRYQLRIEYSGE